MAITAADIALYRRYDGNLDGFSRSADRGVVVSDADWRVIDDLRQRAFIIAKERGSAPFARSFEADLLKHIPDEGARIEFRRLVEVDLEASAGREA